MKTITQIITEIMTSFPSKPQDRYEFDFSNCKLDDNQLMSIIAALQSRKELDQSNNPTQSGQYTARPIMLNLSENNITSQCMKQLGQLFADNVINLEEIILDHNAIGDDITHLAVGLGKNNTLKVLNVNDTDLTLNATIAIADMLKDNKTLKVINARNNQAIHDIQPSTQACDALIEALKDNNALEKLTLSGSLRANDVKRLGIQLNINERNQKAEAKKQVAEKEKARLEYEAKEAAVKQKEVEEAATAKQKEAEEAVAKQKEAEEAAARQKEIEESVQKILSQNIEELETKTLAVQQALVEQDKALASLTDEIKGSSEKPESSSKEELDLGDNGSGIGVNLKPETKDQLSEKVEVIPQPPTNGKLKKILEDAEKKGIKQDSAEAYQFIRGKLLEYCGGDFGQNSLLRKLSKFKSGRAGGHHDNEIANLIFQTQYTTFTSANLSSFFSELAKKMDEIKTTGEVYAIMKAAEQYTTAFDVESVMSDYKQQNGAIYKRDQLFAS